VGATKIPHHIFLGVASFLVGDDDAMLPAEHGQPARHCFVIRKPPVAMQFDPIRETPVDVIQSERPLNMSRDLDTLPGCKIAVNPAPCFAKLCLQFFYRWIKIDVVLVGVILQILQSPFQVEDRSFKIQRLPFHEQ
jgi:hypothetical protein